MLKTKFCELLGIELPIVLAGMGGVSMAELAAAVSEAGGLGTIALAGLPTEAAHDEIAAARKLTKKPLCVNFLAPFLTPQTLDHVLRDDVQAVALFWGENFEELIARVKRAGKKAIWQCGSPAEAMRAASAGADAIIAQGFEAGGHVRGITTTVALVPEIRDAIGNLPLLAAGGLADGRGLAAVLALGADAGVFGTRFLASNEADAHQAYKQRIVEGRAEETIHTTLFDVGWPGAPHRVLRTKVVREWEHAGSPPTGKRPGEGKPVGVMRRHGLEMPLVRYAVVPPNSEFKGDPEELPFYAGQSVSLVRTILPAREIVRMIADEACEVIAKRLSPLA
jgi:nitronate monooxygenase